MDFFDSLKRDGSIAIPLLFVQALKELIVRAVVDFPQFNQHTCPDVQFTGFVLGISTPSNVAAPALQFNTQLLLRNPVLISQPPKVGAHIAISADLLLHTHSLH